MGALLVVVERKEYAPPLRLIERRQKRVRRRDDPRCGCLCDCGMDAE
jgi:hypothetical protein